MILAVLSLVYIVPTTLMGLPFLFNFVIDFRSCRCWVPLPRFLLQEHDLMGVLLSPN